MTYKSVIVQERIIHYITDADMVKFVAANSDMAWNKCCKFVREKGLVSEDGGKVFWTKGCISDPKQIQYYSEDQIHWIGAFFEAHPFIEKMMIVFDS